MQNKIIHDLPLIMILGFFIRWLSDDFCCNCDTGVFFRYPFSIFGCNFPMSFHHHSASFAYVIWIRGKRSSSLWVTGPGFLVSGVMQGSHSPYGNPAVPLPGRGATSQNTDVSDWFIYRDYLNGDCYKRSADWWHLIFWIWYPIMPHWKDGPGLGIHLLVLLL